VDGQITRLGQPVPRNVAEAYNQELVPAQTQHQNMAAKTVLERLKKQENVTKVLVKVIFFVLFLTKEFKFFILLRTTPRPYLNFAIITL